MGIDVLLYRIHVDFTYCSTRMYNRRHMACFILSLHIVGTRRPSIKNLDEARILDNKRS
jgi:hypothetical protein